MDTLSVNLVDLKRRCKIINKSSLDFPNITISTDFVLSMIELVEALEEDRMEDAVDIHDKILKSEFDIKKKEYIVIEI